MMRSFSIIFGLAALSACSSNSEPSSFSGKADIWGDSDDRVEAYQAEDEVSKSAVSATMAILWKSQLDESISPIELSSRVETLGDKYGLCEEQRFVEQPTAADCTGFLVAPTLLLTAGHCIDFDESYCPDLRIVSGYRLTGEMEPTSFSFNDEDVYRCERVEAIGTSSCDDDFALIRLDRAVSNHVPLRLQDQDAALGNADFIIAGHPSGLPLKIAKGGYHHSDDLHHHFEIDAFRGNSGSAIVNGESGLVAAIFVCNQPGDYVDPRDGRYCLVPQTCSDGACYLRQKGLRVSHFRDALAPFLN